MTKIKEEVKSYLLQWYTEEEANAVVNDIVSVSRPGVVMVKEKICGKYTGRLTEMYL